MIVSAEDSQIVTDGWRDRHGNDFRPVTDLTSTDRCGRGIAFRP